MPTPGRKGRALADRASRRRLGLTALVGLAADLATKHLAWHFLGPPAGPLGRGVPHDLVPGWLVLVTSRNPGIVFGIDPAADLGLGLLAGRLLMILLTLATAAIIFYIFAHSGPDRRWTHLWCGLVLAGAAGNLVDRVTFGYVRDFLQITKEVTLAGWTFAWPYVFNLADVYLVIGVAAVAAVYLVKGEDGGAPAPKKPREP